MNKLWAITTYYNPCRWVKRRENYDIFMQGMRDAGVPCITIECVFGDEEFELPPQLDIIRVRADSVLWQKERLINIGVELLPKECEYVAWLDCDITFDDPNWAVNTQKLLEAHAVVQMWETCDRLDKNGQSIGDVATSFGKIAPNDKSTVSCGRYDKHGHTGYAWAARRKILDEVGLYDHAVSGSSDHFMAHAIYNIYGFCIENALRDQTQFAHFVEWGEKFYKHVNGSFTCVPGNIKHLWHGDLANRRYFLRMHDITALGFNPYTDLLDLPGQPLSWVPNLGKPELEAYFMNYFKSRAEDGEGNQNDRKDTCVKCNTAVGNQRSNSIFENEKSRIGQKLSRAFSF